jgi:hypothetical protein
MFFEVRCHVRMSTLGDGYDQRVACFRSTSLVLLLQMVNGMVAEKAQATKGRRHGQPFAMWTIEVTTYEGDACPPDGLDLAREMRESGMIDDESDMREIKPLCTGAVSCDYREGEFYCTGCGNKLEVPWEGCPLCDDRVETT